MHRRSHILNAIVALAIILPMMFILAGCTAENSGGAASATQAITGASASSSSLQGKLAVGILKLEGTGNAITAEQAKELLLLWKGVKSLSTSSTTADEEKAALYRQIQEAMTAEQLQAIQTMSISNEDMASLRQQYQASNSNTQTTTTTSSSSSSSSSSQSSGQGGPDGGGMPGGGGPGGDMGGGMPSGGGDMGAIMGGSQPAAETTQESSTQAKSQTGSTNSDTNLLFASAVIQLLEERANS